MTIFGNKKTFAISFSAGENEVKEPIAFINCNLILNEIMIGSFEQDMLGNCVRNLLGLMDKVIRNEGYRNILFDRLSDDEIIELIYKSNQLEVYYNPAYAYLPASKTNELWRRHSVSLAGSTDPYAIVVFEEQGKLKFLWQAWSDREEGLKNVNFVLVEYATFYSSLNEFFLFVKNAYPKALEWFDPATRTI